MNVTIALSDLFMKALPKKLFRFQALNTNNLDALRARKLWFSSIYKFNDPFAFYCDPLAEVLPVELPPNQAEQQRWIDQICQNTGELDRGKLEDIVQSGDIVKLKRFEKRSKHQAIRPTILGVGVCCFFPSVNNGLCWAHYGDSHLGFAIRWTLQSESGRCDRRI